MKLSGLDRRLAELESKSEVEPVKFRLLWYDEIKTSPEPGTTRIQLKWLDEVKL